MADSIMVDQSNSPYVIFLTVSEMDTVKAALDVFHSICVEEVDDKILTPGEAEAVMESTQHALNCSHLLASMNEGEDPLPTKEPI